MKVHCPQSGAWLTVETEAETRLIGEYRDSHGSTPHNAEAYYESKQCGREWFETKYEYVNVS